VTGALAPSLTQQLAELVLSKPVEQSDLEAAALFTLDALANAAAGRMSEPGARFAEWAEAMGIPSTVETDRAGDAGRRAFILGCLTHCLETDDLHRASVVHPGCVVVPAAWAVAEKAGGSGRDFLTSVLRGFEACCRVGMAVGPQHYKIWHNTATCGPFGAAAATASLLGLDAAALSHALGNAGTQASGLWQFLETGAMSKHLHAGRAAEAGWLAASLAGRGVTGPPAILEGAKGFFAGLCPDPDPEAVLRDPDAPWQLHATSIKPWPSCRHTHPAIDAALSLRARLGGIAPPAEDIACVEVQVYQATMDVCDRPHPDSAYEAKFSIQHCVAAALGLPQVDFAAFEPEARTALAPLRGKIRAAVAEPYASAYPASWGAAVTVETAQGERLTETRTAAKGDPEASLTREELIDKARMLLTYGNHPHPDRFVERVLGMAG